jgi:hypothetical protein
VDNAARTISRNCIVSCRNVLLDYPSLRGECKQIIRYFEIGAGGRQCHIALSGSDRPRKIQTRMPKKRGQASKSAVEELPKPTGGALAAQEPQTPRPAPNRVPSDKERAYISSIIAQDKSEINELHACIEKRKAIITTSKKAVDDVEKSIKLARSFQFIIQSRLDASIAIEKKVATTARSMGRVDQRDEGSESNRKFHDLFDIHNTELTAIRQAVAADTKEVERATSQIRALEQELFDARSKLQMESESIDILITCHGQLLETVISKTQLVSAGRRLPSEILLLIFESLVQLDIDKARAQPNGPRGFSVLLLCSICIRWRELVRNAATLWRYIPIPAPAESKIYEDNLEVFDLYRRHVTSAGQLVFHWPAGGPWQMSYYESTGDPIFFYNNRSPAVDILSGVPSIEVISNAASGEIFKVACNRFIERLTIRNLMPISEPFRYLGYQLKWLSLHIRSLTSTEAQNIFRLFPHLTYLELQIHDGTLLRPIPTPFAAPPSAVVSLPSVTEMATTSPILMALMTSFISAPKLRSIHIHGGVFSAPLELDTWAVLVTESGLSGVDELIFEDSLSIDCTDNRFIVHLEGLVGVTCLDLRGPYLSSIVSTLASRPLLPALYTLRLRDSDITESTIRGLIEARNVGGTSSEPSRINKLVLKRCSNITRTFCDEMKSMVDEVVIYA